ncbi:unnamed protein product [Calypogeia fissa]
MLRVMRVRSTRPEDILSKMLLSTVPGVDDHRGYSFAPFDDLHVGGAEDFQSYYVSASPLNDSRRAQQRGPPLVTAMSGKLHRHGECRRAGALWVGNGSEHGERQCGTLSMFEVDKNYFKSGQHGVNHIRLAAASAFDFLHPRSLYARNAADLARTFS